MIPDRPVDPNRPVGARSYLARTFVECNGLQRCFFVIVYGLKQCFVIGEYREGISTNIGLRRRSARVRCFAVAREGTCTGKNILTIMRREPQRPVERAWTRDSGLPGRMTFILPIQSDLREHFEVGIQQLFLGCESDTPFSWSKLSSWSSIEPVQHSAVFDLLFLPPFQRDPDIGNLGFAGVGLAQHVGEQLAR